ncbi:unnamed protein product [Kluyveromyces dobzhanskii CBS 2104]|uniref:GID complex catalytic subunit 2 n=1 Tax=Kluyveromyces dobzhanskii CBS 2104 TaxID=1427455 RepID=A0A0A8L4L2_9SACH|nr:unnamed protein product [Kluyveromyces dobzhanskii CBS 2104]
MSSLLETIDQQWVKSKLYIDKDERRTHLGKCVEEVHDFKIQLKKLKAHLLKHGSSPQKRLVIKEKLAKSHKNWDSSMKKSLNSSITTYRKFSKACVKPLNEFQLDSVYVNKITPQRLMYLDRAIHSHIARYYTNIADGATSNEMLQYLNSKYRIPSSIAKDYVEMANIINEMKTGNLNTCIKWCQENKLELLHFQLHYLHAMSLLSENKPMDCYLYIQKNLALTVGKSSQLRMAKPVSKLLAKIVIGETIPAAMVQSYLETCVECFTKQYCLRNKLPLHSALFLVVLSGVIGFQVFTKYEAIRKVSHVDWSTADELPFHVKLPPFLSNYHPVFICPVLKEETTKENPPFSLPCHHVLSKKSLDKLSKNGTCNFKCPYCPVMSTKVKTKRVNFLKLP